MCGIFGFTIKKESAVDAASLRELLSSLITLSESRGKEAAGLALFDDRAIDVYKEASRASLFLQKKLVKDLIETTISDERIARSHVGVIGHARLVTNGSMEQHGNNQPVIRGGMVGIHNGIIVNDAALFSAHGLHRDAQVDTEVFLALVERFTIAGDTLISALRKTYREIRGTASLALLFQDSPLLALTTNNGSLYHFENAFGHFFASERYILEQIICRHDELLAPERSDIEHIEPGSGLIIDLRDGKPTPFDFTDHTDPGIRRGGAHLEAHDIEAEKSAAPVVFKNALTSEQLGNYDRVYRAHAEKIDGLKRCAKCILPETMPFIAFDEAGICNYCKHHVRQKVEGAEALMQKVQGLRGDGRKPDCLFPLSGGRDSSYGLHYVKNVLKMHPIAYSYDWGMLTDLGRRNQARMCGELGVEHLLISADITRKRQNIRSNVVAWLKKPDLGTIPLFMAGDKQYFYYLNQLQKQTGIKLTVYSENPLERTNFKVGFCGVAPKFDEGHVYDIGISKKLALAFYYAKSFAANPGYLNASLLDTISAYVSTYFMPHDYVYLFNYLPWDETTINETLIKEYDWELAEDTNTTWRIGDGTAAFYNYIYYTAAGFTENDTFRSNQIREGILSREKALELVKDENRPRFDSMRWYCDTIGIDMAQVIEVVNAMPKRY